MYSSMCFMSVVVLLVMDVRTGALQERNIHPLRCNICRPHGTSSCEQPSDWTEKRCTAEQPVCATVATNIDMRPRLICAPVTTEYPCKIWNPSNATFSILCTCNTHLCNAAFTSEFANDFIRITSNQTNMNRQISCQLFTKYANQSKGQSDVDYIYKEITTGETDEVTSISTSSSQLVALVSVPATMDINSILSDSGKPRVEALKQVPTVPSDDDEDESEGSGSYEESRIHNHAVSAPADPSSFLPANDNSANSLYKDLLVTTLFLYFVV